MNLQDLLKGRASWVGSVREPGPLVSSRIRLARNVKGSHFPSWAGEADCRRIWEELQPKLMDVPVLKPALAVQMSDLEEIDKEILFERHLISRDHMAKGVGSGFVVREDEQVGAMVNEEDHLRLQALLPGLNLQKTWEMIDRLDSEIEERVAYAFSPRLGFLTACPSNVGTGMRASVMLHLPGLVLMNEMGPIIKGMGKIGLAVRGLKGEGTEANGNLFQISNQVTLGQREQDIISSLEQIVLEVVEHEKNARARLLQDQEVVARDQAGRAYGLLSNAHLLPSKEALDLLSDLRLGIELGILPRLKGLNVDELLLLTQPAHLQKIGGKRLKPKERDAARAALIRDALSRAEKTNRKPRGSSESL